MQLVFLFQLSQIISWQAYQSGSLGHEKCKPLIILRVQLEGHTFAIIPCHKV